MKRLNLICAVLLSAFLSTGAMAFPELVRYGYVNCTSCHYSANGGGILTPYGRSLSEDVLSTWNYEGEGQAAYGLVTTPDWLALGGDFRAIQTFQDNSAYTATRFIVMQADAEVAAQYKKVTFVGTLGKSDNMQAQYFGQVFESRRHYLIYQATNEIQVRAGRFENSYGVNYADHTLFVRRGLGFDQNTETYNIEGAYLGEKYDAFIDLNFGRPDAPTLNREQGVVAKASLNLANTVKTGLSYYYGSNSLGNRHLFGPYGIIGFTKRFYLLAELDFQKAFPNGAASTFGWSQYFCLDYELIQGFHVFVAEQLQQLDFTSLQTQNNSHGVGLQWFPRPHWELEAEYQRLRMPPLTDYQDLAWLMVHFYL